MNIDNLTFGELKQIAAIFNGAQQVAQKPQNPYLGKFCIARCYEAGVHAGYVESVDGENVILTDSVRMWSWKAADGIALSGCAQHGVKTNECKFDTVNPSIYLTGVCELIPVSEKAMGSFNVKK